MQNTLLIPTDGYIWIYDHLVENYAETRELDESPVVDHDKVVAAMGKACVLAIKENAPMLAESFGIGEKIFNFCPRDLTFGGDLLAVEYDREKANEQIASLMNLILKYDASPKHELYQLVKQRHQSRSGFYSFYPDNIAAWDPDPAKWDQPQVDTVFIWLLHVCLNAGEHLYSSDGGITGQLSVFFLNEINEYDSSYGFVDEGLL